VARLTGPPAPLPRHAGLDPASTFLDEFNLRYFTKTTSDGERNDAALRTSLASA
jgi:hypothetical protein